MISTLGVVSSGYPVAKVVEMINQAIPGILLNLNYIFEVD